MWLCDGDDGDFLAYDFYQVKTDFSNGFVFQIVVITAMKEIAVAFQVSLTEST